MKHLFRIVATSVALLGMAVAPAMAANQHNGDRGHRNYDRGSSHWNDDRGARNHSRDYGSRGSYRGGYRGNYRPDYYRAPPRVVYRPAPPPYWRRGGYYYGGGYAPTYVINDWGHYGLRAPPRGYYWRRSDTGDFLLVAVTTGIIADLILHH